MKSLLIGKARLLFESRHKSDQLTIRRKSPRQDMEVIRHGAVSVDGEIVLSASAEQSGQHPMANGLVGKSRVSLVRA